MLEKPDAVEQLAVTGDRLTVVLEQQADGKIKVTSLAWPEGAIIHPDEVFEVRSIDRRMRLARKVRHWDDKDRQPTPMMVDPYDFVDHTLSPPAPEPHPTITHPAQPVTTSPADRDE
jgi:hypothetical protein